MDKMCKTEWQSEHQWVQTIVGIVLASVGIITGQMQVGKNQTLIWVGICQSSMWVGVIQSQVSVGINQRYW